MRRGPNALHGGAAAEVGSAALSRPGGQMPKATKTAETKKAAVPAKKAATSKAATAKAAAPAKKAAKAAAGPADKFLEGQRKLLLEERETYTRQATSLRAEAEQLAAEREPGDVQFDEESGEGDTMNVERERDLALSAQARAAVDLIDAALVRIDR